MKLAIDIGNTNIVFGIYKDNLWIKQWRIHTVANKTPDEYEVILMALFAAENIDTRKINKAILSSVVPSLSSGFQNMIKKKITKNIVTVHPDIYSFLNIKIPNPYEIGTDLVSDAVAAYTKYKKNCIIVDFGTALTFTVVDAKGELIGVSIAPGLKTAMNSLSRNTAQLPNVELKKPPSVIGKNTIHAMQSGVVLGYVGLIEYLLKNIKKELQGETKVIATGGLASLITPLTDCIDIEEKSLTLDGLIIIGDLIK